MLTIRNKKQLYSKLRLLMQTADEVYIPLDAETHKSKTIDRIALTASGIAAIAGILLEQLHDEITQDEVKWKAQLELRKLYESERYRLKPPPDAKPSDEDEPGGFMEGM